MYLLKLKYNEKNIHQIEISLNFNYLEFKDILDLIDYLYENSNYISSYEIFKLEKMERPESKPFLTDHGGGGITIRGPQE